MQVLRKHDVEWAVQHRFINGLAVRTSGVLDFFCIELNRGIIISFGKPKLCIPTLTVVILPTFIRHAESWTF